MTQFRFFPAVAGAAACLLVIKGVAILRGLDAAPPAGVASSNDIPPFGRALARARQGYVPPDPDITGAVPAKPKKEDKPAEPAPAQTAQAPPTVVPVPVERSASERAILERLGERREEIEGRAREMDTREALLRAAEKKLDARVGDLRSLEEKLQSAQDNREQSQAQAMKNLVTMYETMKPKEAARVFDRLDHKVLIPVVQKMNPRKMAEVLAAMSPEAAERLTIALATRSEAPADILAGGNELPRINAPQPRAQPPAQRP